MNELSTTTAGATGASPATVVSVGPVVLPAPDRGEDLQVRVSAPVAGRDDGQLLPVIVFSHGFGWSMDAYAPLVHHWAARGFVVAQPTHLDSRTLALPPDDPRTPLVWRHRVADLTRVLDGLDVLGAAVPGLRGRLDLGRIAVAGHSWGGQTASALLGARVLDAEGLPGEDMSDPRVRAGVLLSTPGTGGADLTPFAAQHFPFMNPGFADMTTPTLVVAGDLDRSPLSVRGPDWFTDPHTASPGPGSLLVVVGAEHSLGGIAGHDVAETTDADPARVALVQQVTTAYLLDVLGVDGAAWAGLRTGLAEGSRPGGRLLSA